MHSKIIKTQLAVVIHAEEEFDWTRNEFHKKNTQVSHVNEFSEFCLQLLSMGAALTIAVDYPFVADKNAQAVLLRLLKDYPNRVEIASQVHAWVTPPFFHDNKESEYHSYICNLTAEQEFAKIKSLSDFIELNLGVKPTTYLAGRYGIGKNTCNTLKKLGYNTDISLSPFADFTRQQGPDFTETTNQIFSQNGILRWPHTSGVISRSLLVTKWLNRRPQYIKKLLAHNPCLQLTRKLLGLKILRLSPEGVRLKDLKKLAHAQIESGYPNLIFSYHSPSLKQGLTPYVQTAQDLQSFKQETLEFLKWYQDTYDAQFICVQDFTG
ncbi:hypothetical protein [Catenovulum sediminis]|uniref:WalW protein n=1 Tax=Catenovulum sediminis TaxID=1740262 RepID=A0ABV1RFW8_9ALTE|nr:hypothetical protein [Catenovulum sediminis]